MYLYTIRMMLEGQEISLVTTMRYHPASTIRLQVTRSHLEEPFEVALEFEEVQVEEGEWYETPHA